MGLIDLNGLEKQIKEATKRHEASWHRYTELLERDYVSSALLDEARTELLLDHRRKITLEEMRDRHIEKTTPKKQRTQ